MNSRNDYAQSPLIKTDDLRYHEEDTTSKKSRRSSSRHKEDDYIDNNSSGLKKYRRAEDSEYLYSGSQLHKTDEQTVRKIIDFSRDYSRSPAGYQERALSRSKSRGAS